MSRSASSDPARHRRENVAAQAARSLRWRPALRPCLRCLRAFASDHAGNRLCGQCHDELRKAGVLGLPS